MEGTGRTCKRGPLAFAGMRLALAEPVASTYGWNRQNLQKGSAGVRRHAPRARRSDRLTTMIFDTLRMLCPDDADGDLALDLFIGRCLFARDVWDSPHESDGIGDHRFVERTDSRVRMTGSIWLIADQSQELFWLDLEIEPEGSDHVHWSLHFKLIEYGRVRLRDLRDACYFIQAPEEGTWETTVPGTAIVRDGELDLPEIGWRSCSAFITTP
jgi:hypothetical protein